MRLADLFSPERIVIDLHAASKVDALRALAFHLSRAAGIPAGRIEAALMSREELGSTGVGGGLALPHARVAGVRASCAAVARVTMPVDFGAIDGQPVDLICALVCPDEPRHEALAALSAISRVLRDPATLGRVRVAADAGAIHDLLTASDSRAAKA